MRKEKEKPEKVLLGTIKKDNDFENIKNAITPQYVAARRQTEQYRQYTIQNNSLYNCVSTMNEMKTVSLHLTFTNVLMNKHENTYQTAVDFLFMGL